MKKRTVNKENEFAFEKYAGQIEAEQNYQKVGQSWWENNVLLIGIAIAMAVLDMMFLFDMLDLVMQQNALLGRVGALGIALILNFIPLIVAKQVNKLRYKLDRTALLFAITGVVIFAILYVATVILRFQCLELYTASTSDVLKNTATIEKTIIDSVQQARDTRRAICTAVLLSIEPLATSIFSFLVAIQTDNTIKNQINYLEKRLLELKAAHNRISTALESMWEDKDFMLENEQKQYEIYKNILWSEAEHLRMEARRMLAERLKDPSSITKVMTKEEEDSNTDNALEEKTFKKIQAVG